MPQDTQIKSSAPDESQDNAEAVQVNSAYVRGLLVVVIVLGVLLLGGVAVVIGTIIQRVNNPKSEAVPTGFALQNIAIGNAKLVAVKNGATRIILQLEDAGGTMLIFIDPRNGAELGRLRLTK